MRRYHTVSERNAQDIAGTLALCGEFFQPCFKQMILWLVTYYRSVAGAFDELGSCLENDGDGKANESVSSPLAPAEMTPRNTPPKDGTSGMKTRSAPSMSSKRLRQGVGSLALSGKSKSDGDMPKTNDEDYVENGTPPCDFQKGLGITGSPAQTLRGCLTSGPCARSPRCTRKVMGTLWIMVICRAMKVGTKMTPGQQRSPSRRR